jgi:hypothetical protein
MLRRRMEKNLENILGNDQLGFSRGKEIGMQLES